MTTQKLAEMFHNAWYGQYVNQGEEHRWETAIAIISIVWWEIKHSIIYIIDECQCQIENRKFNKMLEDKNFIRIFGNEFDTEDFQRKLKVLQEYRTTRRYK